MRLDVEPVAAVVGMKRVDDQHVRAGVDELPHEVAGELVLVGEDGGLELADVAERLVESL